MVKTSYIFIENVFRTMQFMFFSAGMCFLLGFLCIHRYSLKLFSPFNFETMIKLWSQIWQRRVGLVLRWGYIGQF